MIRDKKRERCGRWRVSKMNNIKEKRGREENRFIVIKIDRET